MERPSLSHRQSARTSQNFPDVTSGVARTFRDIMGLRKIDPPQLEVCEPQKKGGSTGHHVYRIKGIDHHGVVDVSRRFSHFYELRVVLFSRFLGLYVPPIPEKKSVVLNFLFYLMTYRVTKKACLLRSVVSSSTGSSLKSAIYLTSMNQQNFRHSWDLKVPLTLRKLWTISPSKQLMSCFRDSA